MSAAATPPPAPRRRRGFFPRRRTAVAVAVGFLLVAAFQLSLLLGAPFGAAALGGANPGTLPVELRMVSAINAAVWAIAAAIVLTRGGWTIARVPPAVARWGTWVLVGLLALGALMNLASPSPWERFGWAPFTAVLFVLTLLVALGDRAHQPEAKAKVLS